MTTPAPDDTTSMAGRVDSPVPRPRRFLEVDVFDHGPLSGNPLAVVLDADGMDEAMMRRLAAWTGFSETAFLLPATHPGADYRVRIFTPTLEHPFAGHPTLGSARAWLHAGGRPRTPGRIVQECAAGLIEVRDDGDLLWFATPPRTRTGALDDTDVTAIAEACNLAPDQIVAHAWASNGPEWRIVELTDADMVRAVQPRSDRAPLRFGLVGLEHAQPDDGNAPVCEVRAFGATYEDPVTGSLHGSVAQWLHERGLVPERYVATQGSQVGRDGRVHVHHDTGHTWIGGHTTVMVDGTLTL